MTGIVTAWVVLVAAILLFVVFGVPWLIRRHDEEERREETRRKLR